MSAAEEYGWWKHEPSRHLLDQAIVAEKFPKLVFDLQGPGYLRGELPLWPFERPEPKALQSVGAPLLVEVRFGHAYPASEPKIFPLNPEPEIHERSFTEWHVMGDGSLCLLQDADTWKVEAPLEALLLKAAGWRLEYHLIKAGAIPAMSVNGIVSNDEFDEKFSR